MIGISTFRLTKASKQLKNMLQTQLSVQVQYLLASSLYIILFACSLTVQLQVVKISVGTSKSTPVASCLSKRPI